MARPGLTYEAVANAAESLLMKNEKITILKLRDELGGHGSSTTISKFYKEWKERAMLSNKSETQKEQNPQQELNSGSENKSNEVANETKTSNEIVTDTISDPTVLALLNNASDISQEILNTMSNEWNIILNEKDTEIKIRKLHAALVKEQTRRESAENTARETRMYAEAVKEQITLRINELKDSLEGQIAFLNGQIRNLKKEAETDLEYYRSQLEKANNKISELISDK